ncbi:hypothetical protein C8R44DRAFT_873707 [Mycena epipterygia]|nr:hypothetical protein C8R44DRAFT_873707 [Mycena epipterygia]
MAPTRWTTQEQFEWLDAHIGKYLGSKSKGEQIEFFVQLDEAWFALWPAEDLCDLPSRDSGVALDKEEDQRLAKALEKRKAQLRSWFRNATSKTRASGAKAVKKDDQSLIAAALWQDGKRHRDPQLVELYQKIYPDRVRDGLQEAGYHEKHKGDLEYVGHDGKMPDATLKALLRKQAANWLGMRRAVSRAMLETESDEVKEEMEREL